MDARLRISTNFGFSFVSVAGQLWKYSTKRNVDTRLLYKAEKKASSNILPSLPIPILVHIILPIPILLFFNKTLVPQVPIDISMIRLLKAFTVCFD